MNQMAVERRICTKQKIAKIKMHCYRRKCEDMADMAGGGGRACTKIRGKTSTF
jgi:hypothetical protein